MVEPRATTVPSPPSGVPQDLSTSEGLASQPWRRRFPRRHPNRTISSQRHEPLRCTSDGNLIDPWFSRPYLTGFCLAVRYPAVCVMAMVISLLVGTLIGALSGYFGGIIDSVLMRFTELVIAFPQLIVLILFSALFGGSFWNVVLALGLLRWVGVARIVRASVLQLREMDYVLAAHAIGVPTGRIVLRHVLPNGLGPIVVAATLGVGSSILGESTLSFLGLGIQLPTATWGDRCALLRTI